MDGRETTNPDFSKPFGILFGWTASTLQTLAQGDLSLIQDSKSITLSFKKDEVEQEPMLSRVNTYTGEAGTEVEGLALIQKGTRWIKVYSDETYVMERYGYVSIYEGNDRGLDSEYNRLMGIEEREKREEIVFDVPEFFLGELQSAFVGFNGKNIYFFVNEEFIGKKTVSNLNEIIINNGTFFEYGDREIKERMPEKDGCAYFDGETRLVFPDSEDMFEEGPFAVYLEWIAESEEDWQQLIGHYNWEIWQRKNDIFSRFGRMTISNNAYSIKSPRIEKSFFNRKNSLLVLYNPANDVSDNGKIELFLNKKLADKNFFGEDTIKGDYSRNLSLGHSAHGESQGIFFQGFICQAKFTYQALEENTFINTTEISIHEEEEIKIPIFGTGKLERIELKII
jgi:hypothetical protein